jgi:hypothetical protein
MIRSLIALSSLCLLSFAATPAHAALKVFDFNSLSAGINSTNQDSAGSVTSRDAIDKYLTSVYGSLVEVVKGARTLRDKPENVGPEPFLGNTDNGVMHDPPNDTYLINRWSSGFDRITIVFKEVPITSIELDWQIFPVSSKNTNADLTIKADGETIFYKALTDFITNPSDPKYDDGNNKYVGAMGHFSYVFSSPVTTLEFIDWTDAPIGIDNLAVDNFPPPGNGGIVPEPSTLLLGMTAVFGMGAFSLRRFRRKQPVPII